MIPNYAPESGRDVGRRRYIPVQDHMANDGTSTAPDTIKGRRHINARDHMVSDGVSNVLHYGVDAEEGGHRRYIGAQTHMESEGTSTAVPGPQGPRHIAVPGPQG